MILSTNRMIGSIGEIVEEKMTNRIFGLGILTLLLAFGLAFIGCGETPDGGSGGSGSGSGSGSGNTGSNSPFVGSWEGNGTYVFSVNGTYTLYLGFPEENPPRILGTWSVTGDNIRLNESGGSSQDLPYKFENENLYLSFGQTSDDGGITWILSWSEYTKAIVLPVYIGTWERSISGVALSITIKRDDTATCDVLGSQLIGVISGNTVIFDIPFMGISTVDFSVSGNSMILTNGTGFYGNTIVQYSPLSKR
jgi:hypothetical protein